MRSSLVVTTPAADLQLLTIEELREAAGVTGSDQDIKLLLRGKGIAAAIMSECNIAVGAGGEPTLKKERLTETFYSVDTKELILSRRHNVQVISLAVDGAEIGDTAFFVEPEAGIVSRICGAWCARKIVVVYDAGFADVPGDLKMAAAEFFAATTQAIGRDPFVKSESREIPGLETVRKDYWVGSVPGGATEGAVPDIVAGQLMRFRNSSLW